MTSVVTNLSKRVYLQGVDLTSATIKAALFTSSSNIVPASTIYSSLTGEVSSSGTGYTTGGNAVTGFTWAGTTSPQINSGVIAQWHPADFSYRFVVIYDATTGKILTYEDMGTDQTITSALYLSFDSTNGYIKVSSS